MLEQSTHLSNRTNNFLLASSILIAGTQFNEYSEIPWWLLLSGLLIAGLWFVASFQSWKIIKNLSSNYHQDDDEVDKLVEAKKFPMYLRPEVKRFRIYLRPTDIFAIWIPVIFVLMWTLLFFL